MLRLAALALFALVSGPLLAQGQLTTPTDWDWRQDAPAPLASGATAEPGSWVFVRMPPGWHITTKSGVLLYPSDQTDLAGNFAIEAEIFLFPGESQGEYGIFLSGQDLDGPGAPTYTSFVLRRDGQAAVLRRRDGKTSAIAEWRRHDSILAHPGGENPIKNTIKVDADPEKVALHVNGANVLSVPRSGLELGGRLGFRVGPEMNLHVATLNVTRRLAPVPAPKASGAAEARN